MRWSAANCRASAVFPAPGNPQVRSNRASLTASTLARSAPLAHARCPIRREVASARSAVLYAAGRSITRSLSTEFPGSSARTPRSARCPGLPSTGDRSCRGTQPADVHRCVVERVAVRRLAGLADQTDRRAVVRVDTASVLVERVAQGTREFQQHQGHRTSGMCVGGCWARDILVVVSVVWRRSSPDLVLDSAGPRAVGRCSP